MRISNSQEMNLINGATATIQLTPDGFIQMPYLCYWESSEFCSRKLRRSYTYLVGSSFRKWRFNDFNPTQENSPKNGEVTISATIGFIFDFLSLYPI